MKTLSLISMGLFLTIGSLSYSLTPAANCGLTLERLAPEQIIMSMKLAPKQRYLRVIYYIDAGRDISQMAMIISEALQRYGIPKNSMRATMVQENGKDELAFYIRSGTPNEDKIVNRPLFIPGVKSAALLNSEAVNIHVQ